MLTISVFLNQMLGRASQIKGKCTPSTSEKCISNPLKRSVVHNFNPSKRCFEHISNPLEHSFNPSKRSLEHISINHPQNLVEHNPNPYKRSLGHIFNPEKGQWSTGPTLLKNWLIGVMMRRWENEWKSESPAAQWTLLWANSFTFYILHVSIQRAFWKISLQNIYAV